MKLYVLQFLLVCDCLIVYSEAVGEHGRRPLQIGAVLSSDVMSGVFISVVEALGLGASFKEPVDCCVRLPYLEHLAYARHAIVPPRHHFVDLLQPRRVLVWYEELVILGCSRGSYDFLGGTHLIEDLLDFILLFPTHIFIDEELSLMAGLYLACAELLIYAGLLYVLLELIGF